MCALICAHLRGKLPLLMYSKRWRFRRSTVPHPLRGCTPHYAQIDTAEMQAKVHRLTDPAFHPFHTPGSEQWEYEEVSSDECMFV